MKGTTWRIIPDPPPWSPLLQGSLPGKKKWWDILPSWWFQPVWKILVKTVIFPNRGEHKKYVKPPPSYPSIPRDFQLQPAIRNPPQQFQSKLPRVQVHRLRSYHLPCGFRGWTLNDWMVMKTTITSKWNHWGKTSGFYCWWFKNPVNSPVGKWFIPLWFTRFIPFRWCRISYINSITHHEL